MQLLINNKPATLPKDVRIQLKIKNPAFNNEGTYSYPFNLPKEANRAVMDHIDAEDNLQVSAPVFKLILGGELFMEGDLVTKETAKAYQSYLKSGKSSVAAVLKNSYLDGDINGESWGTAAGVDELNNSVNGIYPEKKFVVAPVQLDKYVINEWGNGGLVNPDMMDGKVSPLVYVRHIIDRINQALKLLCTRDDFSMLPDFNRLCLLAPHKEIGTLTRYADWMPHITAADFLNDVRDRFNIIPYFSLLGNEVAYVHFDEIFNGRIVDWTAKFISDEQVPPFQEGLTTLQNDGEDEEVLSPREMEEKYNLTEVADYADMDHGDDAYKVTGQDRYFIPAITEMENDLLRPLYVSIAPWFMGSLSARSLSEDVDTGSNSISNSDTTVGVENRIVTFIAPDKAGEVLDSISVSNMEIKVDAASAELIAKIELYDQSTEQTRVLGTKRITISNTVNQLYSIDIPVQQSAAFEREYTIADEYLRGEYLRISFYSYHATATRQITLKFGAVNVPVPLLPYTVIHIDPERHYHKEIGAGGTYEAGPLDAEKKRTVKPKSKVLYNTEGRSNGYLFQMPKSDLKPEKEQKNFGYTIYRGLINDERGGNQTAPYCNYDVVDTHLEDYQGRLTGGSTPDLSLRWHGEKGLAKTLHQKRLNWFRHFHRSVRKKFKLTINDLHNLRFFDRIQVFNKLYVVNTISVTANGDDSLSEAVVDLYSL